MQEDVAAVMDAPASTAETTDISAISDGGTDSQDQNLKDGTQSVNTEGQPSAEAQNIRDLRGKELYAAVKGKLEKGEKLTPHELRSIRNSIQIAAQADKAAGGNFETYEAERNAYARLADDPDDGLTADQRVEAVLEEREFWRKFDSDFSEGNPVVVEMMVKENPAAFQQLVVPAVNKFAELNPEGYSAMIAQAVTSYLAQNGLPLHLQMIDAWLPQMPDFVGKEQFINALSNVKALMGKLDEMASKPVVQKMEKTDTGRIDGDPSRLEERELQITRREWAQETQRPGIQIRDDEITRMASTQKVQLTDADRQKINSAVTEELNARLAADQRYGQAMRGYLMAGNRRAYADRALSEYKKLLPSITRRHTQVVIDEKKAQGTGKQQQNGSQQKGPTEKTVKDNSGNLSVWLSGHPRTLGKQVDFNRTTNSMLQRGEAYVKGSNQLHKWKVQKQ